MFPLTNLKAKRVRFLKMTYNSIPPLLIPNMAAPYCLWKEALACEALQELASIYPTSFSPNRCLIPNTAGKIWVSIGGQNCVYEGLSRATPKRSERVAGTVGTRKLPRGQEPGELRKGRLRRKWGRRVRDGGLSRSWSHWVLRTWHMAQVTVTVSLMRPPSSAFPSYFSMKNSSSF